MRRIVPYGEALSSLNAAGLRAAYPRGGALAFVEPRGQIVEGWLTGEDAALRPEARAWARVVGDVDALARGVRARHEAFACAAWLMPKAHWAHELSAHRWIEGVLPGVEVLRGVADASAVELADGEEVERVARALLNGLDGSDFTLAWAERAAFCTLHHRKQVWWQTK